MIGLGVLPGADTSYASAAAADGSAIVGRSHFDAPYPSGHFEAFRWTSGGGMVAMGNPADAVASRALDVSADGSIIVGHIMFDYGGEEYYTKAFIWDAIHGMRDVQTVLMDLGPGPALSGWTLLDATGISDDGRTIVGYGAPPSGGTQGWIAVIPEPSTGSLVIAGLLGVAGYRRARIRGRDR